MLEDADRLLGTVDQVRKAGEVRQSGPKNRREIDFSANVKEAVELARLRHHLPKEALHFGSEPPAEVLVICDPVEQRTADANLLQNAVNHSHADPQIFVHML